MSPARDVVRRLMLTAGLAGGLCAGVVSGPAAWAGPVPHVGIAPEAATDARFAADQTELPLDASRPARVVVLRVPRAAEADRVARVSSDDPSIVQVVHPARLLAGQTFGYLLLRPVAPGQTTLRLGDSTMAIRVVGPRADRPGSTHARAFGPMPEMLTPTAGAGVWGKMNVGAAYWRIPGEPSDSKVPIKLRVGEGALRQRHRADVDKLSDEGPYVMPPFPVDFSDRGPGPCSLRPIPHRRRRSRAPRRIRDRAGRLSHARGNRLRRSAQDRRSRLLPPMTWSDRPSRHRPAATLPPPAAWTSIMPRLIPASDSRSKSPAISGPAGTRSS